MEIIQVFEDYFWQIAEQSVTLFVPILGIIIIFKIINDLLFRER